MTEIAERRERVARVFVGLAVVILTCFVLVQLWLAVAARGPERRVRELMPAVGAQSVDLPLTEAQLDYPLQATPAKGQSRGNTATLRDYARGKLLILNFWATWCEPCVRELPSMLELRRKLADSRVRMVGGMPREIDIAIDPVGEEPGSLRLHFGTRKLPETYVIVDGHVLARFVNERDWTDPAMVEYFQRLLETLR